MDYDVSHYTIMLLVGTFVLPAGWHLEQNNPDERTQALLSDPSSGQMVVIDFLYRGFRVGPEYRGCFVNKTTTTSGRFIHRGRGWRQNLVNEAVEWMRARAAEQRK